MADQPISEKVIFWANSLVEAFTDLNTFQDTDFWANLVEDWEQGVYDIVEQDSFDEGVFIDEIYHPLCDLLDQADTEVEWKGQSHAAFTKIREKFVYPEAYDLHNKTSFSINSPVASEINEITADDDEYFGLPSGFTDPMVRIGLEKISVDPGAPIYVGNARASTIHIISDVPSIKKDISQPRTVERILDTSLARHEWQRQLHVNRVKHISSFLKRSDNFFVNPVILYLPENNNSSAISQEADGKIWLEVDLSGFSKSNDDNFTMIYGKDRPLQIIDGQHRVRGGARSVVGNSLEIPFVLLPPLYDMDKAAKLFAEINTTSKELEKEHQLFLAYRYHLPHHKPDLTMDRFDPARKNYHDRANRLAYQFSAMLSSMDWSLESQIKILKSNPGSFSIDIVMWQKYCKPWFMPGSCYDHANDLSIDLMLSEVNAYFGAWIVTLGDAWIQHGSSGWRGRSIFQYKSHFRVLLRRFQQVREIAKNKFPDVDELRILHFVEALKPLENLPSNHREIINAYNKTGEFYWQCMDAWVEDALDHGVSYSSQQILDQSKQGNAGMGITADPCDPDTWTIKDDDNGNWPTTRSRYIEVFRPTNCHHSLKISVLHGNRVLSDVSRKSITSSNSNRSCKVPIRYGKIPDDVDQLEVRVRWSTATSTLERVIQIQRP